MKKSLIVLSVLAIFLILTQNLLSQKNKQKSKKAKVVQESCLVKNFNLESPKTIFNGVSVIKDKLDSKRGEYETAEDYQQRIAQIEDCDSSKTIYFQFDKKTKYNIDKKILNVYIDKYFEHLIGEYINSYLEVFHLFEDGESYTASNSYGKTVLVKKTYAYSYLLDIRNYKNLNQNYIYIDSSSYSKDKHINISLTLEPSEAKKIADNDDFKILIGVKLKSSQNYTNKFNYSKPTIDDPNEWYFNNYTMMCDITEVLLVDKTTCEVIKKITI